MTPLSAITQNSYGDSPATITPGSQTFLEPPHPRFATSSDAHSPQKSKKPRPASLTLSDDSDTSDVSVDSIMDMYYFGFDDDVEPPSPKGGPHTRFAGTGSRIETGSGLESARDGHARTAEDVLGHETHALDYTNFDGDDDTPLPGENRLSRKLIKEGRLRRAKSRRVSKALEAKEVLERAAQRGKALTSSSTPPSLPSAHPALELEERNRDGQEREKIRKYSLRPSSMLSTEPLLNSSGRSSAHSPIGSPMSPFANSPASSSATTLLNNGPNSNAAIPGVGVRWAENVGVDGASPRDRESLFTLVDGMGGGDANGLNWVLDAQEARDLQAVAEWARPGKPKMAKILADEVDRAVGRVAVACACLFSFIYTFSSSHIMRLSRFLTAIPCIAFATLPRIFMTSC